MPCFAAGARSLRKPLSGPPLGQEISGFFAFSSCKNKKPKTILISFYIIRLVDRLVKKLIQIIFFQEDDHPDTFEVGGPP